MEGGGLATAQRREPAARAGPTDAAIDGADGLAVTDEHQPRDRSPTRRGSGQLLDERFELTQVPHSYTPSVWMPYSPTIESPVFQ